MLHLNLEDGNGLFPGPGDDQIVYVDTDDKVLALPAVSIDVVLCATPLETK
jgi:hypothetical protein